MISFNKIPIGKLDVKTGTVSGVQNKPNPLPNIGMDTNEFHKQVMDLAQKKVPLDKAYQAIDQHPEIQDKPRAKSMAAAVYAIVSTTGSKPNPK